MWFHSLVSAMPSLPKTARSALAYSLSVLVPLSTAAAWEPLLSLYFKGAAGFVALLLVAVLARLFGFGPTMVATTAMGAALWLRIYPFEFPGHSPFQILTRLALFVAIGIMIGFCTLRRSELDATLRSLVTLSPDGIGMLDERSRIVFANPALVKMIGAADAGQLTGRSPIEFVHPDDRAVTERNLANMRAGQSVPWTEERWVRSDGSTLNIEVAGVPGRLRGRKVGQGFVRDVTEKKKAEATLEENRRRLQALFDKAIDAIVFIDANGRYVDANPAACRMLGYTRDEILARTVGDFTPAEHKANIAELWHNILSGTTSLGEFSIRRKDGEILEIEYGTVPNVLPGLHCTFVRDITARKKAERSVRHLSVRLLQLQDEERRRIARQLHDTTAQNLAAVKLDLSRIGRRPGASDPAIREAVDDGIAMTEQSISEIRTLSYLLYPPMIEEAGLLPSLRWYVQGFQERSGIKVALDVPETLERLPLERFQQAGEHLEVERPMNQGVGDEIGCGLGISP